MTTHPWPLALAFAALGGLIAGCGADKQRRPVEMAPIGTVPVATRTAEDPGGGTTTTPKSGTPSPMKEAACASDDSEDLVEALEPCDAKMPSAGDAPIERTAASLLHRRPGTEVRCRGRRRQGSSGRPSGGQAAEDARAAAARRPGAAGTRGPPPPPRPDRSPPASTRLRIVLPLVGVFEKGELEPPKLPIDIGS
jgi:hypothetical protein